MPRVSSSPTSRRRRNKWLKLAKGYVGGRSRQYRMARNTVERALAYSYRDRRQKKRQFRRLWITRINAAARLNGMSYSQFIHAMSTSGVALNRKVLAGLAVSEPEVFTAVIEAVKPAS